MALAPQIQMMVAAQRMAESVERMSRDDDNAPTYRPRMDIPEPFHQFYVELHMDHPYWQTIRCDMAAPAFSDLHPDISDYLREYQQDVQMMEQLARALMEVAFPGAQECLAAAPASAQSAAPAGDAIEEIRKCKALMEEGILTQTEFEAKKKQLLGI